MAKAILAMIWLACLLLDFVCHLGELAHRIALKNLHQHHPHNVEGWIIREMLFNLKMQSIVKTIYQNQMSGMIIGMIIQVIFGSLHGCSKLDSVGCKVGMVGDDVHHSCRLCRIREIGDTIHPVCHEMVQQLALKQMEAGALGKLGFKASVTEFRQPLQVQSHLEMQRILVQLGHTQRT